MLTEMTDKIRVDDFRWLQRLLLERSSIVLEDGRKFLAEKRLAGLVARRRLQGFQGLFFELKSRLDEGLADEVVDHLLGGDTWFFRDMPVFDALRSTVLPGLIAARSGARRLRIWSAGCATGQEAYSLAMLLERHFPELATWDVRVLATDVSPGQIAAAQGGRYCREEVNRGLPVALLMDCFEQDETHWRIRSHLRTRVDFQTLRVDLPWQGLPPMDLILARNVLSYFDQAKRTEVLARLEGQLAPDGVLLLGATERNEGANGLAAAALGALGFYQAAAPREAAQAA